MDINWTSFANFTGAAMQNRILIAGLIAVMLSLVACDQQRINELEDGVASEGDVRLKFGEPEKVWDGPNGARIFEYSRQPEGHVNYMITIGADGKMSALRQVLTPANFAKVTPGMMMEDVRYLEDGNKSMIFTVYFNPDYRVLRTGAMGDRNSTENRNAP
jgi:hypothetical protein